MNQKYAYSITIIKTETEPLKLVLKLASQHMITIIVTYKPPNVNASAYLSQLSDINKSVRLKELVILGDINLYWNYGSKSLKPTGMKLGLYQLIKDIN